MILQSFCSISPKVPDVTSVPTGISATPWAARMPRCPARSATATATSTPTPWPTATARPASASSASTTPGAPSARNACRVTNGSLLCLNFINFLQFTQNWQQFIMF